MSSVDIAPTLLGFAGKDEAWSKTTFPQLVGHDLSALTRTPTARTPRDEEGHLFNYGVLLSWERTNKNYLDRPVFDLSKRRVHRGVFDGRYKFARYFAPGEHHTPVTWEQLIAHNDLELYDTRSDPEEIINLAAQPERHRELILRLNAMTNALVAREVGEDHGGEYPGPIAQYNTLTIPN
ncbi:hypothetical protein D3C72_1431140 [compost metagenome]